MIKLAQIGVLSGGGGSEALPDLTFSEEYVDFTGSQLLLDAGGSSGYTERYFAPRMLYYNGKTYFAYMMRESEGRPFGQLRLLVFDKDRGFDRPVTVGSVLVSIPPGGDVGDTHTLPSMVIAKDPSDDVYKVYMTQERTHMTPLDFYKDVNGDYSKFTFPGTIGLNLAYAHILEKLDGGNVIWSRGGAISGAANHQYSIYVTESDNYFEGLDTATPVRITDKEAQGLWHYPGVPFGRHRSDDGEFTLVIGRRTGLADGGTEPVAVETESWHKFYAVRTFDFVTFTNIPRTYSHNITDDGLLTGAILQANFMYHETDDIDVQGRDQISGVSADGDFYGIQGSADGDGTYLFIYYDDAGEVVKKALTIPDLQDNAVDVDVNPFKAIMAFSRTDIRCIAYKTIGGFDRPHLIKTTDLGDTWEDLGDMCPEVTGRSLRALLPNNIMEIPSSVIFPVYFSYDDAVYTEGRGLICKLASWGSIQAIPGVTVAPAAALNYNNTGLFDYEFIDATLTRSGNDITEVTDNFGIRNATGVNNPQWNGSDTVALVAASSQAFTVGTPASIVNKDSFTFIAVIKGQDVMNFLLTMSLNTADNQYFQIAVGVTGQVAVRVTTASTGTSIVTAADLLDDDEFHVVAVTLDGRARLDIYIDGKRQYFETTLTGANSVAHWEQIGLSGLEVGANVVNIGRRDLLTTDSYSTGELKRTTLFDGVMPQSELDSRIKLLCDTYGITYIDHYQVPS